MARVPTYDQLQVGANTLPNARVDSPSTIAIGGAAARQMQETGAAMQNAGTLAGRVALDLQQQANQVQVDSALNRVKEEQLRLTHDRSVGFSSVTGEAAFRRQSGKSLADDYSAELQKSVDAIGAELGNDAQRAAFRQHASNMVLSLRQGATAHEAEQFKTHSLSVAEGVQATALRDIELNYRNPQAVDAAVMRIQGETYRQAQLLGKSGEWQEAQARKLTSNAHRVAVGAALQANDPAYAQAYLDKYARQMDGDDLLTVRGLVTTEMNQQLGMQRGDAVFAQFAPKLISGPMATLEAITMGAESGGRRYGSDGKLLESSAGAKGEMQVMDATNLDPGFGVRPAKDDSPDERARVGRDYLQALLQHYGGDPAKMWAAYNAGPGRLDEAVKKAEKSAKLSATDPSVQAHDWRDFLPAETRAYVAKNTAALEKAQKGGAVIPKPTEQDIHAGLYSDPVLAANPEAMKVAMAQVKQRYAEMQSTLKQRGEEVKAAAQQALIANGGRWNELSPDLRAQITQYIPGEVDSLKKFNGNPQTDWGLYYDLKLDPKRLEQTNLSVLRDKFADGEFKQLVEEQQGLRDGKVSSSTQLRTTHDYVQQLMIQSGLSPNSKDPSEAEKAGLAWSAVETRIKQIESASGRKLTAEEAKAEAAKVFTTVEVYRKYWSNKDTPAYSVNAEDRVVVPESERRKIVALLERNGQPVDDVSVANVYRRALGVPEFKGKN